MIKIDSITKVYGKGDSQVTALDNINLEINQGDLIAIVGPSGSGKSTLLNIIGCLDKPTHGKYYLKDKIVSSYSNNQLAEVRNQIIGFVVQDFALIDKYTVYQNVLIPLSYSKPTNINKNKKIDNVLKRMGIIDKKNILACNLSGGQRQRVAIARALVNDPEVILADEPTGALDQATGKEVIAFLKEINNEGKTVIIVTHDPEIASECKKRIAMKDGKILSL